MYLMNVPPVAVTQAEWRTCGPTGGYSLPCFHDSDTELSTRGSPISDKVQMIIQSLRSSQSSLEMGDELEANVLSGQEGRPQVCKLGMGSYVGATSKSKGPADSQQAGASLPINRESSDSDSDDSVDRGIEEAIMEYLKEKGDSKQKADPGSTFLQKETTAEENPEGNPFLIPTSPFPRIVKVESVAQPAALPIKKYIKNKASIDDGALKTFDSDKGAMMEHFPLRVKVEEESQDSSSDDGIEEAIQIYQLEKREQENRREPLNPCAIREESDSTSDDGIEEAICRYQLEQLKEKHVLQTFTHKSNPCSRAQIHAIGSTSMDSMKKLKKKKRAREVKPVPPPALKNPQSENQKGKGNGLLSFKVECVKDQPAPVPSKVNTTAELMCAEAILDISKTVMPEVFQHGVGLGGCAATKSPLQIDTCPDEDSDDSSVDSEDGIELEIRKFLEQKAQMQKEPPTSADTRETVKQVTGQRKLSRLSLTLRKNKEENGCNPNMSAMDNNLKVMASESSLEHKKDLNPYRGKALLRKTEQSGDKSSSLDSDEDLDTAIKDLLKTKKKSKKKTRDLKRKSRKCLKDEEQPMTNAAQTKKFKPDPFSKLPALKKVQKIDDDSRAGLSIKNMTQLKQADASTKAIVHEGKVEMLTGGEDSLHIAHTPQEMEEDSSSVDSDDSIEQEIQRFLAEKAKGSLKSKDGEELKNGSICSLLQGDDIKQEAQLAEISTMNTTAAAVNPFSGQSNPPQDRPSLPTPQSLAPGIFGALPHLSSLPSCSPGLMEPADGAGASRTERRSNTSGSNSQPARVKPALSLSTAAHSRSEAIKWRQSFGLPITDTLSRLPFHITSSKINETAPPTAPHQSRGVHHGLGSAWSSAKTGGASFPWTTGRTPSSKSPAASLLSSARQHPPRLSFTQGPAPGRSSPMEGERQSMVHIPKDKSVFVELESNRTNHVQVRSKERSKGKEEGGSSLIEIEKAGEAMEMGDGGRTQEEFVDEAECEADGRRDPDKQQGFSTLSLSSAIDPGITIRPCIALTTEERGRMFSRKYLLENCSKKGKLVVGAPLKYKTAQQVKRKLQFVQVDRNQAP